MAEMIEKHYEQRKKKQQKLNKTRQVKSQTLWKKYKREDMKNKKEKWKERTLNNNRNKSRMKTGESLYEANNDSDVLIGEVEAFTVVNDG